MFHNTLTHTHTHTQNVKTEKAWLYRLLSLYSCVFHHIIFVPEVHFITLWCKYKQHHKISAEWHDHKKHNVSNFWYNEKQCTAEQCKGKNQLFQTLKDNDNKSQQRTKMSFRLLLSHKIRRKNKVKIQSYLKQKCWRPNEQRIGGLEVTAPLDWVITS